MSEDEFTVRRESNCGDRCVIFMDERAETLTCCCVPDSTELVSMNYAKDDLSYMRPSVEQLHTNVPSRMKSTPPTGSE